jgi:hypothetical protein
MICLFNAIALWPFHKESWGTASPLKTTDKHLANAMQLVVIVFGVEA